MKLSVKHHVCSSWIALEVVNPRALRITISSWSIRPAFIASQHTMEEISGPELQALVYRGVSTLACSYVQAVIYLVC